MRCIGADVCGYVSDAVQVQRELCNGGLQQCPRWGGSTGVNYTAINKLPPLRLGSVSAGQTAHRFVAIGLGGAGDWFIEVTDPDDVGDIEAASRVHS